MSAIVVVKEKSTVIVGTDSRYVSADRTRIVTDAAQKIHEIAPETFLATSGYSPICDFQNTKARELAQSAQDVQALAGMLVEASKPVMEKLAATLATGVHLHPDIASAVDGKVVLHGAVLVGRSSRGELGYVFMESRCAGGNIDTKIEECFAAARQITITSATDSLTAHFLQDWRMFSDPPVSVISSVLDRLMRASAAIGGPIQILKLDGDGARWIRRLPAPEAITPAVRLAGVSTISAAVTMTSPTLVITGSTFTLNVDSTNAMLLTATSGTYAGGTIHLNPSTFSVSVTAPVSGAETFGAYMQAGTGFVVSNTFPSTPSSNVQGQMTATALNFASGSGPTVTAIFGPSEVMVSGLPSSYPGAGTKQLWYDPSDGDRVKFSA